MRRDTLSGYLFVLVGDGNDNFYDEIVELGLDKLRFDTNAVPFLDLVKLDRYKFLTKEFFKEKYFSADYLFKWDDKVGNSFGICKNEVYNYLRRGEFLVCSLSFDVVRAFVSNRQVPKKNYILINVSSDGKILKGFDEYSFDLISNDVLEIKSFILRHL